MTLDRLKTLVLGRLDELTRNGAEISRNAPHIRDFCAKMPGFINSQLRVIGAIIPKHKRFSIIHNPPFGQNILDDTDEGSPVYLEMVRYEMPKDFQSAISVTRADGYNALPYIAWTDNTALEIAYLATGEYVVEYKAFYEPVGNETPDDTEVDLPPEAEPALIAGVAAMCVQHENEVIYTQLFTENQGLLANLKPKSGPMQTITLNKLF